MNSSMVRSNNDDIYGQGNLKAAGYAAKSDMAVNALNAGANYWNSSRASKPSKTASAPTSGGMRFGSGANLFMQT